MTFLDGAAAPATFDVVKDGSDSGFMGDVIEASRETPVIVDFWAPWCGPCKQLAPALEKAVRAAKGRVKLVKINIDDNPGVAGQLGVRSIPAVFAFDRGRPVDGFMGALPESQIKLFVDKLAGGGDGADADIEAILQIGADALAAGDVGGAAEAYAAVLQGDPANAKAIAGLARVYLATGQPEEARGLIDSLDDDVAKAPEIQSVRAALELAATPIDSDETIQLAQAVSANPNDHQARYDLANALAARGDLEGAVDHLLTIIAAQRDWNEEAARKQLLKVFEAAGPMSDIAKQGRRRLSAIWLS